MEIRTKKGDFTTLWGEAEEISQLFHQRQMKFKILLKTLQKFFQICE